MLAREPRYLTYILLLVLLNVGCGSRNDRYMDYALDQAGANRAELETVLEHYRTVDADSEKYAAARFLIENMPGHYSYKSNLINEYYDIASDIFSSDLTPKEQRDTLLVLSDNRFYGLGNDVIQDVRIVTSDFLIDNIDKAFDVWRNNRWASHLTFDEFCEWLLPYKCVELQSMDAWRDTMSTKFSYDISHMDYDDECYDSPFRAVNVVRGELIRKIKPVGMYNRSGYPMLSAATMSRMTYGTCADYVNLGVLTFRSMGIPVIIDETPTWGRYRAGHTWYTLLNEHGEEMPSEWDISSCPGSPFFPYQRIPKVYRRTYAINRERVPYHNNSAYKYPFSLFSIDVTDRYFNTTDVDVRLRDDIELAEDYAYIATFNGHNSDWTIVDYGTVKKGMATFKKMGRNILYMVLGYAGGEELVPLAWPFIIHKDGSIEKIRHDYNGKRESIDVRRKYYASENVVAMRKRILDGAIEAADRPNFSDAVVMLRIDSTSIPDKMAVEDGKPHRYWRYMSPDGSYGSIAELGFFGCDSLPIAGKPIGSTADTSAITRAFDGDWLTNFETGQPDGNWVGMDFGHPVTVDSVRVVPRGDDNDIHPGDEYMLCYWDGYFWITHSKCTATDNVLHFDDVPAGSLLWIRNLTRGWDERVFRMVDGKPEWW